MAEYIEREAAIAVIEEKQKELCPLGRYSRTMVYGSDRDKFDSWQEIIDTLEDIPAADVVEVRHGRWVWKRRHHGGFRKYTGVDEFGETHTITVDERSECDEPYCPYCGKWNESVFRDYCPNCGAKMDGGANDAASGR